MLALFRYYFTEFTSKRSAQRLTQFLRHRKKNTWIWHLLKIQPSGYLARFARPKPVGGSRCPGETQRDEIAAKNIRYKKNREREKASPRGNNRENKRFCGQFFWSVDILLVLPSLKKIWSFDRALIIYFQRYTYANIYITRLLNSVKCVRFYITIDRASR